MWWPSKLTRIPDEKPAPVATTDEESDRDVVTI
jgi:hypothetical protein